MWLHHLVLSTKLDPKLADTFQRVYLLPQCIWTSSGCPLLNSCLECGCSWTKRFRNLIISYFIHSMYHLPVGTVNYHQRFPQSLYHHSSFGLCHCHFQVGTAHQHQSFLQTLCHIYVWSTHGGTQRDPTHCGVLPELCFLGPYHYSVLMYLYLIITWKIYL